MSHPVHPASERAAAYFHASLALIGVTHIVGGLLMIWFHGVAAAKHFRDRER